MNFQNEELSNQEQWMSNFYIAVVTDDHENKNQKVFINYMDLSMRWKVIIKHPNKDEANYYEDDPISVSIHQTNK